MIELVWFYDETWNIIRLIIEEFESYVFDYLLFGIEKVDLLMQI